MPEETRNKTPVDDLLADVEAYIEDWFQAKLPFSFHGGVRWFPPTDVYETASEYVVTMAIPGMRIEDISVQFDHSTLRVQGVRREPCTDRRHYHKMEIPVGPFERRVRVTRPVQVDAIRVQYDDGLLHVALPKTASERQVRID